MPLFQAQDFPFLLATYRQSVVGLQWTTAISIQQKWQLLWQHTSPRPAAPLGLQRNRSRIGLPRGRSRQTPVLLLAMAPAAAMLQVAAAWATSRGAGCRWRFGAKLPAAEAR